MRKIDKLTEIRRRWRVRELILEWQRLPAAARSDVIADLEESSWSFGGGYGGPEGKARAIAADALEAMQSPLLLQGLEGIAEDVRFLLDEIDRLTPGGREEVPGP